MGTPAPLAGWAWAAAALAALEVIVVSAMAILGNSEGWAGAVLYCLMYALPALLIAVALWSRRAFLQGVAGWAALLLAVFYILILAGNWSGYSHQTIILAVGTAAPAVALDLAIFWATVLRRGRSRSASDPVGKGP